MINQYSTTQIMQRVIAASIPAILISTYFYGSGVISNVFFSIVFALLIESGCLFLRSPSNSPDSSDLTGSSRINYIFNQLSDYSAFITAILFAMCLPPSFSIFKIFIGLIFAIAVAKHLYGGLGHNIFNPAMVGYLVILIAFPLDFTNWPSPLDANLNSIDTISQATPLDPIFIKNTLTDDSYNNLYYFYSINIAWLLGGLYLLYKKIIPLSLTAGFLLGLFLSSSISYILLENIIYIPVQHLFLGASMIGAFFIITDPITAPVTNKGRWIYSILAGTLCYIIRDFGSYPDGVGFAMIFMNTWVPLINKLTIKPAHIK